MTDFEDVECERRRLRLIKKCTCHAGLAEALVELGIARAGELAPARPCEQWMFTLTCPTTEAALDAEFGPVVSIELDLNERGET